MSTSDPTRGTPLPTDPRQLESLSAVAAGFPDPALLARMANEMFKAAPTRADVSALPAARVPVDADPRSSTAAPPSSPPGGSMPGDSISYPRVYLEEVGPAATAVPIPGATVPTPGIPGGFSAANYATVPSFSFLDDVRSLYASPPAIPVHAMPPSTVSTEKISTESVVGQVPTSLGAAVPPSIPYELAEVSAPQIAGAPSRPPAFDPGISFGFLEEIKPLDPINAIPTLGPVGTDVAQPRFIELYSGNCRRFLEGQDGAVMGRRALERSRDFVWGKGRASEGRSGLSGEADKRQVSRVGDCQGHLQNQ